MMNQDRSSRVAGECSPSRSRTSTIPALLAILLMAPVVVTLGFMVCAADCCGHRDEKAQLTNGLP